MVSYTLVFATTVLAVASAAPAQPYHVLHEKRNVESFSSAVWTKRAPVPLGRELPVRIGLTQRNLDRGHDLLMQISVHDSPRFGQHYTNDEIIELFAPTKKSVDAVSAWLHSAGIQGVSQSLNKQWLQFDTAVEYLEGLLHTKYHEFVHQESGAVHVACDEYHLPAQIREHIDYVTPGVKLHTLARRSISHKEKRADFYLRPIRDSAPSDITAGLAQKLITTCDFQITPDCVKVLYNVTLPTTASPGNQLGIFEDLGDIVDQRDLNEFYSILAPEIPQGTGPILRPIDGAPGPVSQAKGGVESTLDFELAFPLLYPQGIVLFQTDDLPTEENYTYDGFLNNFFDAIDGSYCTYSAFGETGNSILDPSYPDNKTDGYKGKLQCGKYKPTNVISISYGGGEDTLPVSYQRRQCNEMMKLGLQGISIVVASGDFGVSNGGSNNDNCLGPGNNIFAPDFPATCPYVTSVGATFLPYPHDVFKDAEVAVNKFRSGGGFSNIYPQPKYQQDVVQQYLAQYPSPFASYQTLYNKTMYNNSGFGAHGGIYNSIGRGYPDFSAIGDGIVVVTEGELIINGGTSASAPVFASILTRINEERILANKSTIGFVNPTLYAHPEVLHDITKGKNPGCGSQGFKCGVGWDPVTGMGTPNYGKMLELYLSLP